jgi:glutamine synthetase
MSDTARQVGMELLVGSELEFTLFHEGTPIDTTCYAQDAAFDFDAAVVTEILRTLHNQGVPVAQCHPESGPGQWEISVRPLPVLAAADAIVAIRQVVRAVAARHGMTVTFLPLASPDGVGAGMHVHLSFTGDDHDGFGVFGYPFMAGVLEHLRALLAVTAGSPLSLMRFRPRYWAGAYLGWGIDNKEAPLRVILNDQGTPRDVEFKSADVTANPYLLFGCLLAAGLDGIARELQLPEPLVGDPGLLDDIARAIAGIEAMPDDLDEVLAMFEQSEVFAQAMGALHTSFCAVRRAEHEHMRGMTFDEIVAVMVERI